MVDLYQKIMAGLDDAPTDEADAILNDEAIRKAFQEWVDKKPRCCLTEVKAVGFLISAFASAVIQKVCDVEATDEYNEILTGLVLALMATAMNEAGGPSCQSFKEEEKSETPIRRGPLH